MANLTDHPWLKWLKHWRTIADKSSPTTYVSILTTVDRSVFYEVLRVSKFHPDYDGDKPHVETSIREFNDKTALHSKATRDLGIVRVITNNRKPAFVIEPGADVLEWRAVTEGVSVRSLVEVMRAGDLGRRVRCRDRKAAKDSRERQVAIEQELMEEAKDLRTRLINTEAERDDAMRDRDRMKENLIKQNEEQHRLGIVPPSSGTMTNPLEKAQKRGFMLTSNKILPGNFEG
ncbi:MAG: hypothetical protein M0Z26_10740 [Acidithiobacillus sp.]|nr:hypothetical protein [Acidithiobacillus sp.]